jgi:hypothetical protein
MRLRLGQVEGSLAARGRPLMWANEQEAAALSGVALDAFRKKIKRWEDAGFPKVNPENDKRSIPAILAFWNIAHNYLPLTTETVSPLMDDDDGQENFSAPRKGKRLAS